MGLGIENTDPLCEGDRVGISPWSTVRWMGQTAEEKPLTTAI